MKNSLSENLVEAPLHQSTKNQTYSHDFEEQIVMCKISKEASGCAGKIQYFRERKDISVTIMSASK
jgi:hypothetical protein